jgi:creatinine amidohydrolase/Fe(II)-dependent formamide hydrolase-like protein
VPELSTLTAPALRRAIENGWNTVVVPFGSIEHQASHLPIGADTILAEHVGREVATRLDAVLAPTIAVGFAERHTSLYGTLTLSAATLTELAFEISQSLAAQGFGVIVLVSTHGGNAAPLRSAVRRLETSVGGALVLAPVGDVGPAPGAHSGAWLTSVMLALTPELVILDQADSRLRPELAARANAGRGAAELERFVASIVEAVRGAAS